jgi:hypothetical protein
VSWVVRSASDSVVVVEQTDGRTDERANIIVRLDQKRRKQRKQRTS